MGNGWPVAWHTLIGADNVCKVTDETSFVRHFCFIDDEIGGINVAGSVKSGVNSTDFDDVPSGSESGLE